MKSLKFKLPIIFLIIASSCKGQESNQTEFTYKNFEKQIISYKPNQNKDVSKKDFDYGLMILNETKNTVNGNFDSFNLANYFNILSAFLTLKESDKNIKIAFEKFKNANNSCEYFISFERLVAKNPKYNIIRTEYNSILKKCKSNQVDKSEFNIEKYISKNKFNSKLVRLIQKINLADQKYRSADEKTFKSK